ITNQSDGSRLRKFPRAPIISGLATFARFLDQLQRFVESPGDLVAVAAFQSFFDPRRIDLNPEKDRAVHCRGERLRTAHSAKAATENKFPLKRAAELFAAGRGKRLKCTLHDSLATDVNPRTGGHLPVHGKTH